MMNDVESNLQETGEEARGCPTNDLKSGHMLKESSCAVTKEDRKKPWKLLLLILSIGVMIVFSFFWTTLDFPNLSFSSVSKHIKPIKPLHHGKVVFLTSQTMEGDTVYKRVVTAPCAHGILLFNIGPAPMHEPYSYDVYEDAFAYSDNNGLCVFYPSYKGTQTSDTIMWTAEDPTEQLVELGDQENKISHRIVTPPNSKNVTKHGGDFIIIRKGKFYTPAYYKRLKDYVNRLPPSADIDAMMKEFYVVQEEV